MADATADATPAPTTEPEEAPEPSPDLTDAGKQAIDRMKSERNAARSELKAAQAELEKIREASMSDQEKAVALAVAQAKAEAYAEVGGQLVDMAVRAAVANRGIDADALLDGLDRSRFLTEDGKADTDAITAWVDRIAPKPDGVPDLGQGKRSTTPALGSDPLLQALKNTVGAR